MTERKFTIQDWKANNSFQVSAAEKDRSFSERVRIESARLRQETETITLQNQRDAGRKLDQRLVEVKFWRDLLVRQLEETRQEQELIEAYIQRLRRGIEFTHAPAQVYRTCRDLREKRVKNDLVIDEVEVKLAKESGIIEDSRTALELGLSQALEQNRLLKSAMYFINKDLDDKRLAIDIDQRCIELTSTHGGLQFSPESVMITPGSFTRSQWQNFADANIKKGEAERSKSRQLRSALDQTMLNVFENIVSHMANTDQAFQRRIEQTQQALDAFLEERVKVIEDISALQLDTDELRTSVAEKEPVNKLAQTRLLMRSHRPNYELCRDAAQRRIIDEVADVTTSLSRLTSMLSVAEETMKSLVRRKLQLEEEILVKENTLHLDKERCMGLRNKLRLEPF